LLSEKRVFVVATAVDHSQIQAGHRFAAIPISVAGRTQAMSEKTFFQPTVSDKLYENARL